jgi:hypothetical protein
MADVANVRTIESGQVADITRYETAGMAVGGRHWQEARYKLSW